MNVYNVHERLLAAKGSEVGALLDTLSSLDLAERAFTGTVAHPARWGPHTRLLRSLATGLVRAPMTSVRHTPR